MQFTLFLFAAAAASLASIHAETFDVPVGQSTKVPVEQSTNSTSSVAAEKGDKLCKKSLNNIAFPGSALGKRIPGTTSEQCAHECGKRPTECTGVSWGKDGACDLKQGKLVRVDHKDVMSITVRKVPKTEACPMAVVYAENVDYYGGDMPGVPPAATNNEVACGERCRTTPGCVVFTWRKNDKMCFLKGTKAQVLSAPGMWAGQVHATIE